MKKECVLKTLSFFLFVILTGGNIYGFFSAKSAPIAVAHGLLALAWIVLTIKLLRRKG